MFSEHKHYEDFQKTNDPTDTWEYFARMTYFLCLWFRTSHSVMNINNSEAFAYGRKFLMMPA